MPSRYDRQRKRFPGLNRRARREARQEVRPVRRQAKKQIRQGQRQVARVERQGATAARQARGRGQASARDYRAAARSIGPGVATPGLARRQLLDLAGANQRYGQGLGRVAQVGANRQARDMRQDINQIRSDMPKVRQVAASNLAGMISERRQTQRSEKREQQAEIGAARGEAQRLIGRIPSYEIGALHSTATRDALVEDVAKAQGVGRNAARRVVENMYRRMLREGVIPTGVLGDAERRQQSGQPLQGVWRPDPNARLFGR